MSTFVTVFMSLLSLLVLVEFYFCYRLVLRVRATWRKVRAVEERVARLRTVHPIVLDGKRIDEALARRGKG